MSQLFWLNDRQWKKIKPLLPHYGSPPRVDDRRVISGIIHMLRCGARWRDCPAEYGPYTTIYNRFNRWSSKGIWQQIFEALTGAHPPPDQLMADSSYVKAHRCSAGAEKGGTKNRLSVSRAAAEQLKSMP
jgi:transposase